MCLSVCRGVVDVGQKLTMYVVVMLYLQAVAAKNKYCHCLSYGWLKPSRFSHALALY